MATEKKQTPATKTAKKAPAPAQAGPNETKPAVTDTRNSLEKRREVVGTVVSDKMQKTIVVKVDRRVRHGMYGKYVTRSNRVKAHDEQNTAKIGDLVQIAESRPLSRDKRWVLTNIIRRAGQAPEANV